MPASARPAWARWVRSRVHRANRRFERDAERALWMQRRKLVPRGIYVRPTMEQRFWAKVLKSGPIPAERPDLGPCWTWSAGRDFYGYGVLWLNERKSKRISAHVASYMIHFGPVPSGLQIDHLCRNRACPNPKHLEAVTQQVNLSRGNGVAAVNRRKSHCCNGHELSATNVKLRSNGHRRCMTCQKQDHRNEYLRKKAQNVH